MDYTDLTRVKQAMDSNENVKDAVLSDFITRASRYLDRLCTSQPNVSDYFMTEDIADEVLTNGVISNGLLTVFPHKPIVNSISAMAYRYSLRVPYTDVDLTFVSVEQEMAVFEGNLPYQERCYVKISYNGGLGEKLEDLPPDFVDLATILAIRLYKEARSGLGDSIGVAELGTLVYTKAFPVRVIDSLQIGEYMRIAPWT